MKNLFTLVLILAGASTFLSAQDVQVSRQNKTISITAEESVLADAEIATLSFGYHNYAPSHDAAFRENVSTSDKITKALLDANIPKATIETAQLSLEKVDPDNTWTPEMKANRAFEAKQAWSVTVPVGQAETMVALAVRSGANFVADVDWDVVDPVALQAKASGAALAKARLVAEQMAKGLGAKLGELVYASNRAPMNRALRGLISTESASISPVAPPPPPPPQLKLFPQKVKNEATVYAVFAIE